MRIFLALVLAISFGACDSNSGEQSDVVTEQLATSPADDSTPLSAILEAQPDEAKARYIYRHPKETLEFFEIRPGMTVMEALPEGGWYSKILLPYLGESGRLIGADYALDMYHEFGFYDDEFLEARKTWQVTWTAEAESWRPANSATVSAFVLGSMPDDIRGTADAVLYVRALHNLNNYEDEGGYLSAALADTYNILKPGGVVGVVQHQSMDNMPDSWADGSNGYLKRQFVIDIFKAAGFEFVAASEVNSNENDRPSEDDYVWRLPPSLDVDSDDSEKLAEVQRIGESNRMTLKFRKPD